MAKSELQFPFQPRRNFTYMSIDNISRFPSLSLSFFLSVLNSRVRIQLVYFICWNSRTEL